MRWMVDDDRVRMDSAAGVQDARPLSALTFDRLPIDSCRVPTRDIALPRSNCIDGSDSVEGAAEELGRWFYENEMQNYTRAVDAKIYA